MIKTLPSRRLLGCLVAAALAALPVLAHADERIDDRTPLGEVAQGLEVALGKYREIERRGGWPQITEGSYLRPGMRDPRIADLKNRLAITGDYGGEAHVTSDEAQEAALKAGRMLRAVREAIGETG